MKKTLLLLLLLLSTHVWADIPATPVMSLYQFNGKMEVPYYTVDAFLSSAKPKAAGTLAQGSAVIPCLLIRKGKPVTDRKGTPYVGFEVVLDTRTATPASARHFSEVVKKRSTMQVRNHHCGPGVTRVISVRKLVAKKSPPLFDPPLAKKKATNNAKPQGEGAPDRIVRAFHNSAQCAAVNRTLLRRRTGLEKAWQRFIDGQGQRWSTSLLQQARHLDYTLRTAMFEGHLGRGCSAYGACERNTIALSIRNRGKSCAKYQGCRYAGDFQGVASKVSQYNIWDEYLTQISGLTACFLRNDLGTAQASDRSAYYQKLQAMYSQNVADVQRILFGNDQDLRAIFPGNTLRDLKQLRHYYHAPAMGKCFPKHKRAEYMSGAIAQKGADFALIANTRIRVDKATKGGYFFRIFDVTLAPDRDEIKMVNSYPGFVVDGRKVRLRTSSRCTAYGISGGCRHKTVGRYRRVPPWLKAGRSLALQCNIKDRGAQCQSTPVTRSVKLGGTCDVEMRPVTGVK